MWCLLDLKNCFLKLGNVIMMQALIFNKRFILAILPQIWSIFLGTLGAKL